MGEQARVLAAVAIACTLVAGTACGEPGTGSDAAQSATVRMIENLKPPAEAAIYVAEKPFAASQSLRFIDEIGGVHTHTTEAGSETWFFMVDMKPEQRRGHPIKYVFLSGALMAWIDASWFASVEGTGGWEAVRALDAGENPAAVIRSVPAVTSALTPDPAWVSATMRTISQTAPGRRKAIVIDGGDEWLQFPTGLTRDELWKKFEKIDSKIEFARQADELAKALPTYGYSVDRLSGLANREAPAPTPDRIAQSIREQAAGLGPGDELLLYFGGHGNKSGIVLSDKVYGAGLLSYEALNKMLEAVAPGVKKVVILDSCESGAAGNWLKGVQLHYAADEGFTAPVGLGDEDSYTESLLQRLPEAAKATDPIQAAAKEANLDHIFTLADTVARQKAQVPPAAIAKPTIDLNGVAAEIRSQWAKQNAPLTMGAPTCTPNGTVEIPVAVACTYVDSGKNTGAITLDVKADSSWTWRSTTSARHTDYLIAEASRQFTAQLGRSMQSIACARTGLIPLGTTVSCTYTDPVTGPGRLTLSVAADASWTWQSRPEQAAQATVAPVKTAAPPVAPAAFSPSFQTRIKLTCGGDSRLFFTVPAGVSDALTRVSATPSTFSFSQEATRSQTIFTPCNASGTITVHRSTANAWSVTLDATITTGGYGSGVVLEITPLGGSTSLAVSCSTSTSGGGVATFATVGFRNGTCATGGTYSGTNPAGADTFGNLIVRDLDKGPVTGATGRAQITFTLTPN